MFNQTGRTIISATVFIFFFLFTPVVIYSAVPSKYEYIKLSQHRIEMPPEFCLGKTAKTRQQLTNNKVEQRYTAKAELNSTTDYEKEKDIEEGIELAHTSVMLKETAVMAEPKPNAIVSPAPFIVNDEFFVEEEKEKEKEETLNPINNCYTKIFENMSLEDYEEFAKSLYLETCGSSWDCRLATCEIYLNRALSPNWGGGTSSIHDVINQKGQFETTPYINQVEDGSIFYWKGKYSWGEVDLSKAYEVIDYCFNHGRTILDYDYFYFDSLGGVNGYSKGRKTIGGHTFSRGKAGYLV